MPNKLKRALQEKKLTCGAWIQIGHPAIGEIFARAGFDWICVDLEHGHIGIESMTNIFRAMSECGSVPVVRLPKNDSVWIKTSLDAGAKGIIVPMVNSAAEAREAVKSVKFPPFGERSFGFSRANAYGEDFNQYVQNANDEISLIVQIEHKDAIQNLSEILAVPGIDAAFIGPYDLSGSYGKPGNLADHDIQAALTLFLLECDKKKIVAGLHIVHPDESSISDAKDKGYTFMALGMDSQLLAEASKQLLRKSNLITSI